MAQPTEQPTGTVTFLFTDIEGSTSLWERDPSTMSAALVRHDEVLRGAIERHGGHVFATGGDGFAIVFASAGAGLAAAVAAQHALAEESWPAGAEVRVRMGLHAGEADERGGDYFGPPLNLAARLMSTAHGGQIVCTAAVADLVWGGDLDFVDLGDHRLRDIESTVRVKQVRVPGGEESFPPLRSLRQRRSNLPEDLSSFIGRRREREEVAASLRGSRLVTLLGAGGVGKTRLAMCVGREIATEFVDGVWFCDLAPVNDYAGIVEVVASALDVAPPQGVSVASAVEEFFVPRELLLVLDNCEHVVSDSVTFVSLTLAGAAGVRVMTTSREALGLVGEVVVHLPSLSVPADQSAAAVLASEAGALFVDRARSVRPAFDVERSASDVTELCTRLDGIPLAIELAAARVASIELRDIVGRLGRRFEVLGGGRTTDSERHQTLRAAVAWSFDLLDDRERTVLQQLATVVGGFDLAAAIAMSESFDLEEIEVLDVLGSLVAKSLVERSETEPGRYRLLETIREFAAEALAGDGGTLAAKDRHARHYLEFFRAQLEALATPADYDAIDTMVADAGNVHAAAEWAAETGDAAVVLAFFTTVPPTVLILLPTSLTDLMSRLVEVAFESHESLQRTEAGAACDFAVNQAFMDGEVDQIERWAHLAEGLPRSPQAILCGTIPAAMRGDMRGGASMVEGVLSEYGNQLAPLWGAHALAMRALFEVGFDPPAGLAHVDDAIATCRAMAGPLSLLYPLLVRTAIVSMIDPDAAVEAAAQVSALDRTSRRINVNLAAQIANGRTGIDPDNRVQELEELRTGILDLASTGARGQVVYAVGSLAEAIAVTDAQVALRMVCIAEAIAGGSSQILGNPAYEQLRSAASDLGAPGLKALRDEAAALPPDEALGAIVRQIDDVIRDAGRQGQ